MTAPKQPAMLVIGQASPEFDALAGWLQSSPFADDLRSFPDLSSALPFLSSVKELPDFVIVLQTWPDEYRSEHINQLIGLMLFRRVIVSYGAWCISQGRTHDLWPVACRVPVASTIALLELELSDFHAGTPALLPMAAAEEVFAHRNRMLSWPVERTAAAVIACTDDALNGMIGSYLMTAEFRVRCLPRPDVDAAQTLSEAALVIAEATTVDPSLSALLRSTNGHVIAITPFPGQMCPDWADEQIELSELLPALHSILCRFRGAA